MKQKFNLVIKQHSSKSEKRIKKLTLLDFVWLIMTAISFRKSPIPCRQLCRLSLNQIIRQFLFSFSFFFFSFNTNQLRNQQNLSKSNFNKGKAYSALTWHVAIFWPRECTDECTGARTESQILLIIYTNNHNQNLWRTYQVIRQTKVGTW